MPAGNVAGLLDLEGDAAQTYGGGEGSVAEGASGSGSERIARLSEASASTVHLPWKCRARLFAGSLVLDNWQVGHPLCSRWRVEAPMVQNVVLVYTYRWQAAAMFPDIPSRY